MLDGAVDATFLSEDMLWSPEVAVFRDVTAVFAALAFSSQSQLHH